jgi:ribosomal protein S18 acetylase RimI-like enzyme
MPHSPLKPTAFRGDPDVGELHDFFRPERQFAGDTLWTFGTSLKSAYVNSFEFLNHAPVVQLWRDAQGVVQAVSQLMLGTAEWYYLAAPDYRREEVSIAIIEQADDALNMLSAHPSWRTVLYESDASGAKLLADRGYTPDGVDEVYMTQSLEGAVASAVDAPGYTVGILDPDNPAEIFERGDAQTDAFLAGQPRNEVEAWMTRTIPRQLGYGRPKRPPSVIAKEAGGKVGAFADVFFDHQNKIGEFEPVGTRKGMQRRGLAKAVLTRGLELMVEAGMHRAVVRTGLDNPAAIGAYASVGFEITDHLLRYRKQRNA